MVRQVGERTAVAPVRRKTAPRRTERRFQAVANPTTLPPVEKKARLRPAAASTHKPLHLTLDVPLFLVVVTLIIFGLVMVYSASYYYSLEFYGNSSTMFLRQVAWVIVGLGVAAALWRLDYHYLHLMALPLIGLTLIMLIVVLIMNNVFNGAARTLLGGSIQPSELAKLAIIIYLAAWLHSKREVLSNITFGLLPLATILGLVGAMIAAQPDLSAFFTIILLGGFMFFLAGGDMRQIIALVLITAVIGVFLVQFHPTGKTRLEGYLIGLRDPLQANYQVLRAFEAFVRGGWFGLGIGNAMTKLTGLPVPPTDSIYAVVCEETGVAGALVLLSLYVLLLWRGIKIAQRAPDPMGMLLVSGICIWICLEAFINMSSLLNILPFMGNALPFISAGGSNLVTTLAAIGIVFSVARQSVMKSEEENTLFDAFVSLRRWDRRRRVSGPGRPADPEG